MRTWGGGHSTKEMTVLCLRFKINGPKFNAYGEVK